MSNNVAYTPFPGSDGKRSPLATTNTIISPVPMNSIWIDEDEDEDIDLAYINNQLDSLNLKDKAYIKPNTITLSETKQFKKNDIPKSSNKTCTKYKENETHTSLSRTLTNMTTSTCPYNHGNVTATKLLAAKKDYQEILNKSLLENQSLIDAVNAGGKKRHISLSEMGPTNCPFLNGIYVCHTKVKGTKSYLKKKVTNTISGKKTDNNNNKNIPHINSINNRNSNARPKKQPISQPYEFNHVSHLEHSDHTTSSNNNKDSTTKFRPITATSSTDATSSIGKSTYLSSTFDTSVGPNHKNYKFFDDNYDFDDDQLSLSSEFTNLDNDSVASSNTYMINRHGNIVINNKNTVFPTKIKIQNKTPPRNTRTKKSCPNTNNNDAMKDRLSNCIHKLSSLENFHLKQQSENEQEREKQNGFSDTRSTSNSSSGSSPIRYNTTPPINYNGTKKPYEIPDSGISSNKSSISNKSHGLKTPQTTKLTDTSSSVQKYVSSNSAPHPIPANGDISKCPYHAMLLARQLEKSEADLTSDSATISADDSLNSDFFKNYEVSTIFTEKSNANSDPSKNDNVSSNASNHNSHNTKVGDKEHLGDDPDTEDSSDVETEFSVNINSI
ncbi:Gic2p SCDLUD_004642 [Saccharomycodes ludwigii]|uniref:Gic2p n=1 Tax=Saccharomycodes ludwigii TaxID=36035 RepID=UPI001E84575D|nr:hypothetical protein SCDLUD_004642 [Saccharomycodes ludwigii]KAH3899211.1 hypothetical protein SCDLUD_004642 [Saccharomycodes ludwigii]